MTFRRVDPALWRWVGAALMSGIIPEGENEQRGVALRRVLELPVDASREQVEAELAAFRAGRRQRQ